MFYICPICGNVIYMMNGEVNRVRCCGKEMLELKANDKDASLEKHVPYCEVNDGEVSVNVGEVEHPMTEEHYIMWIAKVCGDNVTISHLNPGDKPVASFTYEEGSTIYAYCNQHSLWKKDI